MIGLCRIILLIFCWVLSCESALSAQKTSPPPIQHIIIIMQENRSFDNYFGTFPGANGFPAGTCIALYHTKPGCIAPFHDYSDINAGGPHRNQDFVADLNGGKMNGFIPSQEAAAAHSDCVPPTNPLCVGTSGGVKIHDVAGYHTAMEIPNYWDYATHFVLQDAMFESVSSFSLPAHLYLLSEWSARCKTQNPMSCSTEVIALFGNNHVYPWTDLTYLLNQASIGWKYYLGEGLQPDCDEGEMTCPPTTQASSVESFWNPMPQFASVKAEEAANPGFTAQHIVSSDQFLVDVKGGTLPSVSWIVPQFTYSEHPPASVQTGMIYVSSLINAIMNTGLPGYSGTNYWKNTVIILAWDDWGGFYDHVVPPVLDTLSNGTQLGYGFRVPSIIISPYVKAGTIDNQTMSFDAFNKFIEDIFLGGQRLDPATDGRPNSRPDVREAATTVTQSGTTIPIGDLMNDFNFSQKPLAPVLEPTTIPLGLLAQRLNGKSVYVTWDPVTTDTVAGYNLQRSTSPDSGYTPIAGCTGAGFLQSTCTDATAPAGTTYYYIVSSILPNGTQSPNSAVLTLP